MTINPVASPTTVGFFFQGNAAPTWTAWTGVSIGGISGTGFAFVPVSAAAPSTSIYTGIADEDSFNDIYIYANQPWLVYSGELDVMSHVQIDSIIGDAPQFINAYGNVNHNNKWSLDIAEMESTCTGNNGTSMRIAGSGYTINKLSPLVCAGATLQWDASSTETSDFLLANVAGTFNITGNNNHWHMPEGADNLSAFTTNNTGFDNWIKTGLQWNPINGTQPARDQFANPGSDGFASNPFGQPNLSIDDVAFRRTADFLEKGALAYYFNDRDLWWSPLEVKDQCGGGSGNPLVVADSTTELGYAFVVNTTSKTNQYICGVNNVELRIGSQIPQTGKITVYFKAKAASSTNMTVTVKAGSTTLGTFTGAQATSGYYVESFDVDVTGYAGQVFILNFSAVTASTQIAWVGIRPWFSSIKTASLQIGSGTAMTGSVGTGGYAQETNNGTKTNGDFTMFDNYGDTVDSGYSIYTVPTSTTSNPGKAACIYSTGPLVIGTCTTIVDAYGGCTP